MKLTYNTKKDEIVMIHKGKTVAFLDAKEFGSLIHEVKRLMEEASPTIKATADRLKRKAQRKAQNKQLINQLKIMTAIKVIDFWRWIKSILNK